MPSYSMRDLKNYRILTLGTTGSGKTVLLASLFKKLSIQGDDTGFFLRVDDGKQGRVLDRLYKQIQDAEQPWPRATDASEIIEWKFTCCVEASNLQLYDVLHFNYLDYPGGLVTQDGDFSSPIFNQALKSADILLGLLDGQKILTFMDDSHKRKEKDFVSDLIHILRYMQNSEKPIHFVITKWDILEKKYSLQEILTEMNTIVEFKNLTQRRIRNNARIRVIPVSSVGPGFAVLQPDGTMQKKRGVVPHPVHIEMPLICVLPDKFQYHLRVLELTRAELEKRRNNNNSWLTRVTEGTQRSITVVLDAIYDIYDPAAPDNVISLLERKVQDKQELEEALKSIKNEATALRYTIPRFLDLVEGLEKEFPESLLSRIIL